MNYKQLQEFRQQVYDLLNFAQDATFELTDAVLTTRNVYSLAELSLSPFFRRKWPSLYEALQDCRQNRNKLPSSEKRENTTQKTDKKSRLISIFSLTVLLSQLLLSLS
jgi:hypothetical protein